MLSYNNNNNCILLLGFFLFASHGQNNHLIYNPMLLFWWGQSHVTTPKWEKEIDSNKETILRGLWYDARKLLTYEWIVLGVWIICISIYINSGSWTLLYLVRVPQLVLLHWIKSFSFWYKEAIIWANIVLIIL